MKFRQRKGPKSVLKEYNLTDTRLYAPVKKPRTQLMRYKDEVFGSLAEPGILKKAYLVDQFMKWNPNFMKRRDLPFNDRNFSEYAQAARPVRNLINREEMITTMAQRLQDERERDMAVNEVERARLIARLQLQGDRDIGNYNNYLMGGNDFDSLERQEGAEESKGEVEEEKFEYETPARQLQLGAGGNNGSGPFPMLTPVDEVLNMVANATGDPQTLSAFRNSVQRPRISPATAPRNQGVEGGRNLFGTPRPRPSANPKWYASLEKERQRARALGTRLSGMRRNRRNSR
mmetsp:Transcript_6927/g.11080  ORF Transcript_6927/g.11080 Transcript_6927/m.11080 type:complete len:289 (+) Transcript_6927:1212-2078(+)